MNSVSDFLKRRDWRLILEEVEEGPSFGKLRWGENSLFQNQRWESPSTIFNNTSTLLTMTYDWLRKGDVDWELLSGEEAGAWNFFKGIKMRGEDLSNKESASIRAWRQLTNKSVLFMEVAVVVVVGRGGESLIGFQKNSIHKSKYVRDLEFHQRLF